MNISNIIFISSIVFVILVFLVYFISNTIENNKLYRVDKSLFKNSPQKANDNPIPKILYKICLHPGKQNEYSDKLLEKIQTENQDYKIILFNDYDCTKFIIEHFNDDVLFSFNSLIPPTYKCDLMRFCILYIKGGVYGDLFQDYYLPLDKIIDVNKDKLVLVQDYYNTKDNRNGILCSFLAALPKQQLFMDCINEIVKNVKTNNYKKSSLSVTGPGLISEILYKKYLNEPYTLNLIKKGEYIINYHTKEKIIKLKTEGCKESVNTKLVYGDLWKNKKVYLEDIVK